MVLVSHGISSLLKANLLIQVSKSHMRRGLVMRAAVVEDLQETAARVAVAEMVMVVAVAAAAAEVAAEVAAEAAAEASPAGYEVISAATIRTKSR